MPWIREGSRKAFLRRWHVSKGSVSQTEGIQSVTTYSEVRIGDTPDVARTGTYCTASVPKQVPRVSFEYFPTSLFKVLSFSLAVPFFSYPKASFSFPIQSAPFSFPFSGSSSLTYWHIYWALDTRPGPGETGVLRTSVWGAWTEPQGRNRVQWAQICAISQRRVHFKRGRDLSPRSKPGVGNFRFQT